MTYWRTKISISWFLEAIRLVMASARTMPSEESWLMIKNGSTFTCGANLNKASDELMKIKSETMAKKINSRDSHI